MQLTTERQDLLNLLAKLIPVVNRKNTIPILANIVLSADEYLKARATDLDIEVTGSCAATVLQPGETTVNAEMLFNIVKSLPSGALIDMTVFNDKLTIKAGRFKTNLATLSVTDYPVMASSEYESEFDMPAAEFKRLFDKTKFAISTEETRYYLNGVYLHNADGKMKAVATDGHRLALAEYGGHSDAFAGVIVPTKTVMLISGLSDIGDVSLSISATKIMFQHGSTTVVSKVIDGTFPDYTRVIPQNNRNVLIASASVMKSAANRVALVSDERARAVALSTSEGQIAMTVKGQNGNDAEEFIDAEYTGDALVIGVNSKYLAECLTLCNGDDVTMKMGNSGDPIIIIPSDDDGVLMVVMPMRV
jgi:DNA polymerase-3 subunit beta